MNLPGFIVTPIVNAVADVWKTSIQRDISEAEMKSEVAKAVGDAVSGIPEAQAKILQAEATGHSTIQRIWRPLTALMMAFGIFWYLLVGPQLHAWFGLPIGVPGDIILTWAKDIVIVFGSVYAGGRSLEKIVSMFGR
jgi:hypothetical protein